MFGRGRGSAPNQNRRSGDTQVKDYRNNTPQ